MLVCGLLPVSGDFLSSLVGDYNLEALKKSLFGGLKSLFSLGRIFLEGSREKNYGGASKKSLFKGP
jgi:hypothetical protein